MGAKPLDFSGNPQDAILRLSQAIPLYTALAYPHLIKLMGHFSTANGYAVVFEWTEGECLHSHWSFGGRAKYTHPDSPFYRFRKLPIAKRLNCLVKRRDEVSILFKLSKLPCFFLIQQNVPSD